MKQTDMPGLTLAIHNALIAWLPGIAALCLKQIRQHTAASSSFDSSVDWEAASELMEIVGDVRPIRPMLLSTAANEDAALARLGNLIGAGIEGIDPGLMQVSLDALRLATRFLTPPDHPHLHSVVQNVAIRALARAYDVRYDPETVSALKAAHSLLGQRFARSDVIAITHGHIPRHAVHFLVDCLCLRGLCARTGKDEAAQDLLVAIARNPHLVGVGVDDKGLRYRSQYSPPSGATPFQLRRLQPLPPLNALIRFVFAQPTGVPGFDAITGGLLAPMLPFRDPLAKVGPAQGIITLIGGPPGSGKTTLALTLASSLAELGIPTTYLGVEEPPRDLANRVSAAGGILKHAFSPVLGVGGNEIGDAANLSPVVEFPLLSTKNAIRSLALEKFDDEPAFDESDNWSSPFRRVVVIDSITTLLDAPDSEKQDQRDQLILALRNLKRSRRAVFLVGTSDNSIEADLAYLVDNVVNMNVSFPPSGKATRSFTLEKTRHQLSMVGRHSVELGGFTNIEVLPSLPAWLELATGRDDVQPDPDRYRSPVNRLAQLALSIGHAPTPGPQLQDRAHTLIFGSGSASKARFAMYLATLRAQASDKSGPGQQQLQRTLVVSFLYNEKYYRDVAADIAKAVGTVTHDQFVDVYVVPAGPVEAPSVVAEINRRLKQAELEGKPFASTIIDGVHNLLVQFPNLQEEPLFLPTLLRTLRTRPLSVFVTFTRFTMQRFRETGSPSTFEIVEDGAEDATDRIRVSQQLLYHLLVSRVDYCLLVQRSLSGGDKARTVKVALTQSIDRVVTPQVFSWDPGSLSVAD